MQQIKKMGPLQNIIGMLPGVPKELKKAEIDDREIARVEAIIRSMTLEERRNPQMINGSRRLRIAKGSGVTTTDVNHLLKQFKEVQKMMKMFGKGPKGKRAKVPMLPGLP
jgi:signal recognition particle subunit SRP54